MNLDTPSSRRNFFRHVGAAGLVAWSAPSIKSVPLAQAAVGSPPPGGQQPPGGNVLSRPGTSVLAGDITRGGADPRVGAGGVNPQALANTGFPATRFLGSALTLIAGGKVILELARRRERLNKIV